MKTKELEAKFTAYPYGLPLPVITTDEAGKITGINTAATELFFLNANEAIGKPISEFVQSIDTSENIQNKITRLGKTSGFSTSCIAKACNGTSIEVKSVITALLNASDKSFGAVITLNPGGQEDLKFRSLETIFNTISTLGNNYQENVNMLTKICGELLGADSAIYNRLDGKQLHAIGQWHTASDFPTFSNSEGRICYDTITQSKDGVFVADNLNQTSYMQTDPYIKKYGIISYAGHMVRCDHEPVAAICALFKQNYRYTDISYKIINSIALLLESEETRESLRKTQTDFFELFDSSIEGLLLCDEEGHITASNKSIQKSSKYSANELIGKHLSKLINNEPTGLLQPFLSTDPEQSFQILKEKELIDKKGNKIAVEIQYTRHSNKSVQVAITEITARKKIENRLQLSENTYRGITNSLNDSIFILDRNGLFLDVNDAAENMFGYEKSHFLHKNPLFLTAPGLNDLEKARIQLKEAFRGSTGRYEFWALRKDDSIFPIEVSLTPGIWYDRKVVIAVGRDITERKQAEELLSVSEEKYRKLVQYSSDPIFSFEPGGTYKFVNDAFASQFGLQPEDIIGQKPDLLFSPANAILWYEFLTQAIATGDKSEIEMKWEVKGNQRYLLTMGDPIKDEYGNVLWVTCIAKDITQRRLAEEELRLKNEQLRASNAEKDKFFSIVAHDLRGPMNGFLGLTGIMAEDIESLSSFELKEIATTMRTSAVNIYRLIENLLEWSKMQRGTINFEPQPMFLKKALNKSLELVKDAASKKGIELAINIPEHAVVSADVHMLETIVRNLLSNAIKFSFKGGVVEIKSEKTENKMVQITVKDNGIGMNSELLGKLFKLTENTNRKGTEGEPSTGLGLILCKEFVEKHGGKLIAISEEGKGSSFIFTLPQS